MVKLRIKSVTTPIQCLINRKWINWQITYIRLTIKHFDSVCVSVSLKENERLTELVKLEGNFTAWLLLAPVPKWKRKQNKLELCAGALVQFLVCLCSSPTQLSTYRCAHVWFEISCCFKKNDRCECKFQRGERSRRLFPKPWLNI